MEDKDLHTSIIEQLKSYLNTKFKLLKYEAVDTSSAVIAEVITDVILAILALMTFIFFSFTLAMFAAHLLSSYWEGFGCVTLLYIIILLSARLLKISIQNILIGRFIKIVFKK